MSTSVRCTAHALFEMARRGLSEETVQEVIRNPDERIDLRGQRQVLQKVEPFPPDGKGYLVRVVVEKTEEGTVVVTAYRTSKIEKYGRKL